MTAAARVPKRGGRGRGLAGRVVLVFLTALALAAVAFFLVPTAQVSMLGFVQVNGVTRLVPREVKLGELSSVTALLGRPGSTLNITGDVTTIGGGSPAIRLLNGKAATDDSSLGDGAVMLVRHGEQSLEAIKRVTEEIPFETELTGHGVIVSLAQVGQRGEREIFKGVTSSKQAAVFTVRDPKNEIVKKSSTTSKGQKLAALTFDDGPGPYTQGVIDALAAKHVPATFFVLGSSAAGRRSLIAKERAAGNEVENHSWDHAQLTKLTADQIKSQITRTDEVIGDAHFLRPPYGSYDAKVAAEAGALGLWLVLWTVDTRDWEKQDVAAILGHVKDEIGPGGIILMHDGGNNRAATVAAIPVVVDWLFGQGYSLTTVENLL